ncbi:hypothetical protein COH20_007739 [Aspergillus flavus]|nr:hypothetical protein COH20_007739 [Aspergillus flavus]
MDANSVSKHVQPWQQIFPFIARTQAPHTWKSPPYGMTPRQRKRWRQLWQCATYPIDQATDPITDPIYQRWMMSDIEQACLGFCIELLNQTYYAQEYESVLICAMAMLGRGESGWRDAKSYPPILSRVIKIARFMIIQKALWLDPDVVQIIDTSQRPQNCADWTLRSAVAMDDLDSLYGSEDERESTVSHSTSSVKSQDPTYRIQRNQTSRKTFQEQVTYMVGQFMVRGTHTPMETLQDWRTYGLKIHYNTIEPGHVTWIHPDQLLYQHIQFTMSNFRAFVHGLTAATHAILCDDLMFGQTPVISWQTLYDDPTQTAVGWSFLRDSRTKWPVDGATWLRERVREPGVQKQFIHYRQPTQFQPRLVIKYLQRVTEFKEKLAVLIHIVSGQPSRIPELLSLQHVNTETNRRRNIFIEDGIVSFVSAYHKGFHASNDVKVIDLYLPLEQLETWYQTEELSTPASTSAYLWGPDPGTQRTRSSNRFREVLQRGTKVHLRYAVNIQAYRDIAIGISRRWMRPAITFRSNVQEDRDAVQAALDDDAENLDEEPSLGYIAGLQAARSPDIAGMVYGREIMEQGGSTSHRQRMCRLASTDWHRLLGFSSVNDSEAGKRKRAPWEDEAEVSPELLVLEH